MEEEWGRRGSGAGRGGGGSCGVLTGPLLLRELGQVDKGLLWSELQCMCERKGPDPEWANFTCRSYEHMTKNVKFPNFKELLEHIFRVYAQVWEGYSQLCG